PILVIPQKISLVKGIERGLQEHPHDVSVSHLLEAAIRRQDASIDDPEAARRDLLTQKVIFRIQRLLMEATELIEFGFLKEHEHARAEGLSELRDKLNYVIAQIQRLVLPTSALAPDVRGEAVQLFLLHLFYGAANQGRIFKLDVGIDKQDVRSLRQTGAGV